MTVVVKKGDYVLKTYNYKDHMDSWVQLILLFLMPFNFPPMVYDSVMDNMIMNFAHDFSSDLQSGVYHASDRQRRISKAKLNESLLLHSFICIMALTRL